MRPLPFPSLLRPRASRPIVPLHGCLQRIPQAIRSISSIAAGLAFITLISHLRAEPVTPEQRALIATAIPASAPARPAKSRRILVYTETKGYRHASIETGTEAIRLMGERTGAYGTTTADKPDVLTAESLKHFDAVVFLNATGEIFDTVERRHALLAYVRNGGGVVGIHGATDACYQWPDYGEMMGGYFQSHPWTDKWHVTLWNEDPTHPLNAAFAGAPSFAVQDEIYQLKDPYSRRTHRVILSLDLRRSGERHPDIAPKITRTDNDFAVSQLRTYDKGRVFYCSLGHNHAIYWNPTILAHYLAGIQWAMGDLPADATPRARPSPPPLAADPALYAAIARTGNATDQAPFEWLDHAIAEARIDPKALARIENQLSSLLANPASTPAARQAAAQRLGEIIPANPSPQRDSLNVLAPLLLDSVSVNHARLALEPIPGRAIDAIFLDALSRSQGEARQAIIHSIGQRRIRDAVTPLKQLLNGSDPTAATSAATALGNIATAESLAALEASDRAATPPFTDAILLAADRLPAGIAVAAFARIESSSAHPPSARLAALRGLIKADPATALHRVITTLEAGTPAQRAVALEAVTSLTDRDVAPRLGKKFASFDASTQAAVLRALARRGEAASAPIARSALQSPHEIVRLAALEAFALLPGTPEFTKILVLHAAGSDRPAEVKAAMDALAAQNGPKVAAFITEGALRGSTPLRIVFIRLLASRGAFEEAPALAAMRGDSDPLIRMAALEALEILGGPGQQGALLDWALAATDAREANRAVRSLIATTLRNLDVANRNAELLERLENRGPAAQTLLLPALVRLADDRTLEAATRLLHSPAPAVVDAAVAALSRWPTPGPLAALLAFAEDVRTPPNAGAAARTGAVKHFSASVADPRQVDMPTAERLLNLSLDENSRRTLLFLLSRTASPEALTLAERQLRDPALASEAQDVVLAIRANLEGPPVFTSSSQTAQLKALTDNSLATFWSVSPGAGQQLTVDFHRSRPIHRLILERGERTREFPPAFEVYVTDDPATPGTAKVSGTGSREVMDVVLPAGTRGRYVIIRNTKTRTEPNWSIAEFRVE